jgi:hypothetical protein
MTNNVNTLLAKHLSKRICQASLIKRSMQLSSWCNDWALPILSGYAAGPQVLVPHLARDTSLLKLTKSQ